MKYIQLNNTELNISPICLGTAGFGDKSDLEKSFEILNAFVWAGGNFIGKCLLQMAKRTWKLQ